MPLAQHENGLGERAALAANRQPAAMVPPPPSARSKVSILVVDDRPDKLLALESVLMELDQNLVKARSGEEALRCLLRQEFALILLDVSMPGMDGFETASMIRRRPRSEHTPIIFVTSINESDNHIAKGYSLGAVDYILSPIAPSILKTKVAVFVDLFRKTEEVREQAEQLRLLREAEHRRNLAMAVDRLEAETKRNRFFVLSLDLLAIANFDGYFLQMNPAWEKTLGYTTHELTAQTGLDLVHPEERAGMEEELSSLKSGTCTSYFEGRYRCKDGSFRWLGWTAAPFVSDSLIYIFARDITSRKQAESEIQSLNSTLLSQVAELTRVNQELEMFSYSISHDLRSPLRAMEGYAQILLEEHSAQLDAQARDYIKRIIGSSVYMDRMLRDLLAYNRIGYPEGPSGPVPLEEVVKDVVEHLTLETGSRDPEILIDHPLATVQGDATTLKQVLSNLLTNAAKFVEPSKTPRIRIWSQAADGSVRLWVEDNGIGIAPDNRQRIFGLFHRLHTKGAYPGTGVGLALVKKGVDRMKGKVGVESEPGQGSRFWVELPPA